MMFTRWAAVRACTILTLWFLCVSGTAEAAEPGLTVYRASKLDWQVRLVAGDAPTSFSGVFIFTEPLVSHQLVSVEPSDRVYRPAPTRLEVAFNVWPGWDDGVNFTTPEFTGICLRSATGQEQVVHLHSPGQPEPLRVTTPVDLTNTGACGVPSQPFPPPTHGRKFNAGHYVVLTPGDEESSMAESVVPGVKGFVRRYAWRRLEPTRGSYDFSAIDADLEIASRHGVQLIAQIEDKSFTDQLPTPEYLRDRTLRNLAGGYTVVRWDPLVVRRYKALVQRLGWRYDWRPNFEGIATVESAHGFDLAALEATGYTPEKYRETLVDVLSSAASSFPRSRVFWYMNYLWGGNYYLGDVARRVAPLGVAMGGPDVMPDDRDLQRHSYPFYDGAVSRMPLFGQVEPSCYHHPHADESYPTKFWTPQELLEFARDDLHVSYMFWVRWRWRIYPEAYNWWDAIPVIEGNPTFNR